jgi:superfamily II DNA/RNA helicase
MFSKVKKLRDLFNRIKIFRKTWIFSRNSVQIYRFNWRNNKKNIKVLLIYHKISNK